MAHILTNLRLGFGPRGAEFQGANVPQSKRPDRQTYTWTILGARLVQH